MKSISELVGDLRDELGIEPISKVVDSPKVLRCQVCGRFFPVGGRCSLVHYDDYHGAWEHD